jgi:ketosteroid isomerase-like protein
MSHENLELVRASYEAFARGDFEASINAYTEDTEYDDSRVRPDGGMRRGREALGNSALAWLDTFTEYSFELEDVLDAGDQVVVVSRDRGRGKTSGVEVEHRWGWVVSVSDGRIARTVLYPGPEEALEAAGLRE